MKLIKSYLLKLSSFFLAVHAQTSRAALKPNVYPMIAIYQGLITRAPDKNSVRKSFSVSPFKYMITSTSGISPRANQVKNNGKFLKSGILKTCLRIKGLLFVDMITPCKGFNKLNGLSMIVGNVNYGKGAMQP